jgi:hypothetical protein
MFVPSFGVRHRVRGKVRWRMSDREAPDHPAKPADEISAGPRDRTRSRGARIAERDWRGNVYSKRNYLQRPGEKSSGLRFHERVSSTTWFDYVILTSVTIRSFAMRIFHKALAAALLCGTVGFALPGYAADYGSGTANPSSTAATPSAKDSTNAANTSTPAKETKRTVPRRSAARAPADDQHNIVEALNQKSLQAVQSGQTPDFAAVEPARPQGAGHPRYKDADTPPRHQGDVKKGA